jgi:hypothetical protein
MDTQKKFNRQLLVIKGSLKDPIIACVSELQEIQHFSV